MKTLLIIHIDRYLLSLPKDNKRVILKYFWNLLNLKT